MLSDFIEKTGMYNRHYPLKKRFANKNSIFLSNSLSFLWNNLAFLHGTKILQRNAFNFYR